MVELDQKPPPGRCWVCGELRTIRGFLVQSTCHEEPRTIDGFDYPGHAAYRSTKETS